MGAGMEHGDIDVRVKGEAPGGEHEKIGLGLKYFVLKPRSKKANDPWARASRMAMIAYAKAIDKTDHEFAEQILEWAGREARDAVELMNAEAASET